MRISDWSSDVCSSDLAAFHDRVAMNAGAVHVDRGGSDAGLFVIEGAGEDAGGGRLADATHAGEHEGVGDAAPLESVREGANHGFLADQVAEIGGAVFEIAELKARCLEGRGVGVAPGQGQTRG